MKKAIFIVGGPGSGKDIVLKYVLTEFSFKEYKVEQLLSNAHKESFIERSIIVSTNAHDINSIERAKCLLEDIGFETSMIFVDVSESVSMNRLSLRNSFSETNRKEKYIASRNNLPYFMELFDKFMRFENNALMESYSQLSEIKKFCIVFLGSNGIFESKGLTEKLVKKYSVKKRKQDSSPMFNAKADNVMADYAIKADVGYPTSTYMSTATASNVYEGIEAIADTSMFASAERPVNPTEFYGNPVISKIKNVAKKTFYKKRNG